MATRIKLRRDTAANWLDANPILAAGETGFETDTRMVKLGDGSTHWADLKYAVTGDMRITGATIASDTGISFSSGSGDRKNWALTINGTGEGPTDTYTDAVAYDSQGNAFVFGWYNNSGSFLAKLDSNGQVLWNNYYNEYSSYGFGVSVDHDDNAVMILSEDNPIVGNSEDIVVVKVSGDTGTPIWQRYIASAGDYGDYATSIEIDHANNILITGWSSDEAINSGIPDFLVAKLSGSTGDFIWQKLLAATTGCNTDVGWGIAVDPMGDVCIVGDDLTGGPTFMPIAKRNGVTGAAVWQTRILDQLSWNGNIYTNWVIYGSGVVADSQGDFYVSWWGAWSGDGPGFPGTQCGVTKLSGVDGTPMWSRQIGFPDFLSVTGAITCDGDNIYVHSSINDDLLDQGNGNNRVNSVIVKFNTQGTMLWQRRLQREQYTTFNSIQPYPGPPLPGGQTLAVNDEYLLIGGTQFITEDYSGNQNWVNQPFLVQVDKDGTEFSVDGWHFVETKLDITSVTPVIDNQQYFDDLLSFDSTLTNVVVNSIYHAPNIDTTDLSYRIMPKAEVMTFEGGKLTLPKGGSVDIAREAIGYITSVGSFDGPEGSNLNGDVWFNGVVRDALGGSYAVGAWYDYGTFNDSNNNRNVPITVKFDDKGQIVWQASDTLNYWSGAIDVMMDPVTSNPVVLSLDNVFDGSEGFTIKTLDANSGLVVGDVTHIGDAGHDQWLWARNLALMSDGTPVVVGYINSNRDDYLNVTSGGAGLAGSNNTDTLVIPKAVFAGGRYPTTNGLWYISNPNPSLSSAIIEVNHFTNNGSGFTATNISSTGTDAAFIVDIDPITDAYKLTIVAGGSGYVDGDTLSIASEVFLPTAGLGDIAITVTTDGSGVVTTATTTSTSSWANIELKINSTFDFTSTSTTLKVYEETGDDGFIWTPNWNIAVGAQTGTDYFHALALDAEDNIIVGGYYNQTGLSYSTGNDSWPQNSMVVKYSSTGTQQWAVSLDGTEGYGFVTGIVTDPDNNIYAMKQWTNGGSNYLLKLDPTGNMLWQINIGHNQMGGGDHGIAIDSDRNILIGGEYGGEHMGNEEHGYNSAFLINKIDTDGNLLWTRQLYSRARDVRNGYNDDYRNVIDIHGDRFSIVGYSNAIGDGNYQGVYVDLPLDGSGTGHYNDYIYEAVEYLVDRTTTNQVTPFTPDSRTHAFTATVETNVLTIYTDRQTKIETGYNDMGGDITSVNKIVFEDGSEQSTSGQDIPQVPVSRVNSNNQYILRLEDRGHHVYSGLAYNNSYVLVPRNDKVPFPIGTAITIVSNQYDVVIGPQDGDTTVWGAGTGDSNNGWWIPAWSMATLLKVEDEVWMLAGAGLGTGRYW